MTGAPRWLVRLALLAYPAAFRHRFGDELVNALHQAWAAAAPNSPIRHRSALLVRTIAHGLAERTAATVRLMAWRSDRPHLYAPSGRHAGMWDGVLHDLRAAVRALAAARGFTALAVLALALGIGANGAIFAVVNGVLLRPLPYRDADRLVMVWSENPQAGGAPNVLSAANFADLKAMNRSFAAMDYALSFMIRAAIIGQGDQGLLAVARVGDGMLELLGAQPQLGRLFGPGERGVAVLSDAMWRNRFGADPAVIGRRIVLSGNEPLEIIGVVAAGFAFPHRSMLGPASVGAPQASDLWVPMPLEGPRWVGTNGQFVRGSHALVAVARLKPGVSVAQADSDVAAVAATLATRHPDTNRGWGARVVDLHEQTVGAVRPALLLLLGGAGVLLVMAMVNVANLMLARSVMRQRELAVRSALGAGTPQLVRQVLAEGLILAIAGALVSLGALRWVIDSLVGLAPASLPRVGEVAPDATVVVAAAVLAVFCGGVLSLLPMWTSARPDVRTVLQDAGRGATGASRAGRRLRTGLVVGQVALASVLAVQAGLLARSFAALLEVDPGFRADHLLTLQMGAPDHLTAAAQRRAFYDEFFARLRALPGVITAGGTTRLPLGSTNVTTTIRVEGRAAAGAQLPEIEFRRALHDYFGAMQIPVRRGRVFTDDDGGGGLEVAVVNDTLAARVFPGEDPIGRRVALGTDAASPWMTIVGVVGDVHHGSLEEPPPPELYVNFVSNPPFAPFVAVRTAGEPDALALSVRQLVRGLDPGATISEIRSMESIRRASVGERRFTLVLASLFGAVALALAAFGVYGVVALVAAERTAEMGLRIALGAVPRQVARLVAGGALTVTCTGLAIGLGMAAAVAQLMKSQLYGIAPIDPVTFIAAPVTLVGTAIVAATLPAWRAMRLDPLRALNDR
jgi:putative ABC transport system permease protein